MEATTSRVVVDDARDGERHLRVSWHPSSATVVFSHWNGVVCTASTPVSLQDAGHIARLLVGALTQGAARAADADRATSAAPARRRSLLDRLRPPLAEVIDITRDVLAARRAATHTDADDWPCDG